MASQKEMTQYNQLVKSTNDQFKGVGLLLTYTVYYLVQLLCSVLLISIYAVMIMSEHPTCFAFNESGLNAAEEFNFQFKLGFNLTLAEFVNSSLINIILRVKATREIELDIVNTSTE